MKIETGKDNTILRTPAESIGFHEFSKYKKIGEKMVKYIKDPEHGGVGVAGPQIGISKRIICVSLMQSYESEHFKTIYMINPEIFFKSKEIETDEEGCLSLPGLRGPVQRSSEIKVQYFDEKKKQHTLALSHLAARIVQHEVDHLDGILFIDHISDLSLLHTDGEKN